MSLGKTGKSSKRLYTIWCSMRDRCKTKKLYVAQGISVYDDWQVYEIFEAWAMSNGYSDQLLIDRIDTLGDYHPNNCRWTTPAVNSRNRTNNRNVALWGETKCVTDWVTDERTAIRHTKTFYRRVVRGLSDEDALLIPTRR